jgi:hypothetical protein
MKNYIIFTNEELEAMQNGLEVSHIYNDDETLYFVSEERWEQMKNPPITNEEWDKAIKHLDDIIVMYATIGWVGRFALDGVLTPLKKRYESGERTKELYDAIMECE